jgi:signal transduction histidine kinase
MYGITCRYHEDGLEKPISDIELIILFRSARELLLNAIKHSRAKEITVSFTRDRNEVVLAVQDNGIGLDAGSFDFCRTGGIGLLAIRERMEHVYGRLQIESNLGSGSRFSLIAPIEPKSQLK